jgi:hypothetical protein
MTLVSIQISAQFAEDDWIGIQRRFHTGLSEDTLGELIVAIKRQSMGLGLIDVNQEPGPLGSHSVSWKLTQKGRRQLLGVRGLHRSKNHPSIAAQEAD